MQHSSGGAGVGVGVGRGSGVNTSCEGVGGTGSEVACEVACVGVAVGAINDVSTVITEATNEVFGAGVGVGTGMPVQHEHRFEKGLQPTLPTPRFTVPPAASHASCDMH